MGLQRNQSRKIAEKFGMNSGEKEIFNEFWNLKKKSDTYEKNHHDKIEAEFNAAFEATKDILEGNGSGKKGQKRPKLMPVENRRYVIFSDHHIAFNGHRQNFFVTSGNKALYKKILKKYFEKDYFLVENGDVEELLIIEPTLSEAKKRASMKWRDLFEYRLEKRELQLRRIMRDNDDLYGQISSTFFDAGRFIKIAGNHDYDIQNGNLLRVFRSKYFKGMKAPYDYLLLRSTSRKKEGNRFSVKKKNEFMIMHGHQYDMVTNPEVAPYLGETISESLSWAFQGADRIWKWKDNVDRWATGRSCFKNLLVSDEYKYNDNAWNDFWYGAGALFSVNGEDGWEYLFKHNVAWEYFEEDKPSKAIRKEVKKGDEFFKFRHLNELRIKNKINNIVPKGKDRPVFLFGHSHEPRFYPEYRTCINPPYKPYKWILNSAAAGRFENLIWAIEIDDGVPRLVSWSLSCGPCKGKPERRVYDNIEGFGLVKACDTPEEL